MQFYFTHVVNICWKFENNLTSINGSSSSSSSSSIFGYNVGVLRPPASGI